MNDMSYRITRSFRMEMMGTGLYRSLSAQYRKSEPELSRRFSEFARQEHMHGRLFEKLAQKTFGKPLRGDKFWLFMGRLTAFLMRPLSLKSKMKKLSAIESQAVADIEKVLSGSVDDGLRTVMKTILPDEKVHAGLYRQIFPSHEEKPL